MKNQKNERGITLVALVVTIVVLLILAGITIMYVMGDNSVFSQASQAKTDTEEGAVREAAMLSITANVLPNLLTGKIVDDVDPDSKEVTKSAEEKAMELFNKGLYKDMTPKGTVAAFNIVDADGDNPATITITSYEVEVGKGDDAKTYKVTYDTNGLKVE